MVDLDREQDIEELRRIAHAQQAQIRILLEAIERQQAQLAALKGTKSDAQLTLKMLEALQAKAKAAEEALAKAEAAKRAQAQPQPDRKPRTSSGRPPSRSCRWSSRCLSSTMRTARARAAAVASRR